MKYLFFKMPISDKKMAQVMYAILRTKSKLVNSHNIGLDNYSRKQVSRFIVDVVIEIDESKVSLFEELAEVKLNTSEQFQGKMKLNNN